MRILHLPTAVGGNACSLSRGERELGYQSDILLEEDSVYGHGEDAYVLPQVDGRWRRFFHLWRTYFSLCKQYDVFHFNFGQTLIHYPQFSFGSLMDLPFYPKSKGLFVTYNGCDARQKFPTMARRRVAACHEQECYNGVCNSGSKDQERRRQIRKMFRYVRHGFAVNPDLLAFLPKGRASFLPYAVAPTEEELSLPLANCAARSLRVVHAPTQRVTKGTAYLEQAVRRLERERSGAIELVLVEGRSHREARALYATADVVVDQLLVGWYGAFAVEAMFMGKPVIAYLNLDDCALVPLEMRKQLLDTVISATPSSIYDVLKRCLDRRDFLRQRASNSREYACRWHLPQVVAKQTVAAYEEAFSRSQ